MPETPSTSAVLPMEGRTFGQGDGEIPSRVCAGCGAALRRKRQKVWCSDACRMRNYRQRTAGERAAMLDGISLAIRTLEELRRKHASRKFAPDGGREQ